VEEIKPVVSVLMVTYNREQYIRTALKSVLRQKTSFPFEIIICEDCSTDNTLAICKEYANNFPTIIRLIVNEQNLGYQRNNLKCLKAAKGKYIAVCDPDDYWISQNKLQIQFNILEQNPQYSLCFHRVLNYYENDGSKSLSNGSEKKGVYTQIDLSKKNFITNVSCFFRNNIFDLPDGIEEVTSVDYVFSMLCGEKGDYFYIPKVMAVYRKSESSIFVGKDRAKGLLMSFNVRQFLIKLFSAEDVIVSNLKLASANILYGLYKHYKSESEFERSAEILGKIKSEYPEFWNKLENNLRSTLQERALRLVKQGLTLCRKQVSKLFPLPKIR
jgi:glycosyltransferase involved in cell wall biosynthesis